jgi:hypothetical protein
MCRRTRSVPDGIPTRSVGTRVKMIMIVILLERFTFGWLTRLRLYPVILEFRNM